MKQTTLKPDISNGYLAITYSPPDLQPVENFHKSGKTRDVIGDNVCSKCGYRNIPGLVICWYCGYCLSSRIRRLAK